MTRRRSLVAPAIAGVTAVIMALVGPPALAAGRVTHFDLKGPANRPYSIVNGPDGNLWFTESDGNAVGRISPAGALVRYRLPTPDSEPNGITVGPLGDIWFTERLSNRIGVMDLFGNIIAEYDVPTPDAQPWDIVAPSDDNVLWFTEENVDQIASITTDGTITEYPLAPGSSPTGIAASFSGVVWFTEETGNAIGRIKVAKPHPFHTVKIFDVPTEGARPSDISFGVDSAMWFTELAGRNVGRVDAKGRITEFPVPGDSGTAGITSGPDAKMWFTQNDLGRVGSITQDGQVGRWYRTRASPFGIAAGPDSGMWFCEGFGNSIGRLELGSSP